ncbi:hypothetical protein ACFVVQ_04890 [Paenibacillus chitinolyticus]|uniref:hypothetical protein n=1 Tax=Paenibacillus chitinolyticus TaxID=79263 RepID=UPI0036D7ABD5
MTEKGSAGETNPKEVTLTIDPSIGSFTYLNADKLTTADAQTLENDEQAKKKAAGVLNALGIDRESFAVSLHSAAEEDAANRPDGDILDYTSDGQDTLHVSLRPDKTTVRFD